LEFNSNSSSYPSNQVVVWLPLQNTAAVWPPLRRIPASSLPNKRMRQGVQLRVPFTCSWPLSPLLAAARACARRSLAARPCASSTDHPLLPLRPPIKGGPCATRPPIATRCCSGRPPPPCVPLFSTASLVPSLLTPAPSPCVGPGAPSRLGEAPRPTAGRRTPLLR
jgi:hypothetical protein